MKLNSDILIKHYNVFSWIAAVLLSVIFAIWEHVATPHCRAFSFSDPTIGHAHKPSDTFPTWSLVPVGLVPIALGVFTIFLVPTRRIPSYVNKFVEINTFVLMIAEAFALQLLFMVPGKLYAGRLRPDFVGRLELAGYNATFPDPLTTDYCAITDKTVVDGRKSFPSGHSSTSFGYMVPITLFLFYRLQGFRYRSFGRLFVSMVPLFFALVIAVSRTRDHVHNYSDILAGAVIGCVAGHAAFHLNYTVATTKPPPEENDESGAASASPFCCAFLLEMDEDGSDGYANEGELVPRVAIVSPTTAKNKAKGNEEVRTENYGATTV